MSRAKRVILKNAEGQIVKLDLGELSEDELLDLQAMLDQRAIACEAHSFEDRGEGAEEAALRAKAYSEAHSKLVDKEFERRDREAAIAAGQPLNTPYEQDLLRRIEALKKQLADGHAESMTTSNLRKRFEKRDARLLEHVVDALVAGFSGGSIEDGASIGADVSRYAVEKMKSEVWDGWAWRPAVVHTSTEK